MLPKRAGSKSLNLIWAAVAIAAIGFAGLLLIVNRQYVSDFLISSAFQPSGKVRQIETNVGFTKDGQRVFYAAQPSVLGAEEFNQKCPRREEKSPILGCYSSGDRLYIYEVTNEKLDGIEEVTAAHEMLHAVWSRLSTSQRSEISNLLDVEYERVKDEAFEERMAYYSRTQPGDHHNELHSILATEYSGLSPELERHYSDYFKDRDQVVSYHEGYSRYYNELRSKSEELAGEIDKFAGQINSDTKEYGSSSEKLSSEINDFNSRARSGSFSSTSAFNTERSRLVQASDTLEQLRIQINENIQKYNQLYESYNEIASEIDILNKSLDSFESLQDSPRI